MLQNTSLSSTLKIASGNLSSSISSSYRRHSSDSPHIKMVRQQPSSSSLKLHSSCRSSKTQLYDLLTNSNNSSSIPTNSSTPNKKTQSSSISLSPAVRCSKHVQRANPEAAAKPRGRKITAAHTSSSASLSVRLTTAAAKNSSVVPPALSSSPRQASPLPRQVTHTQTFLPALPSAAPPLLNYFPDNPHTSSSQTVTILSPPTQRADPNTRLPSLAIPPPPFTL